MAILKPGKLLYDRVTKRFGRLQRREGAIGFVKFSDGSCEPVYLGSVDDFADPQPPRPALAYAPPRLVARDGVRVEGV